MPSPPPAEKTKYDRVKETVTLLKKLLEFGISDGNDGYMQIKDALDEWIKTGDAAEHFIPLRTYRRNAVLTLPKRADRAAELVLKAL